MSTPTQSSSLQAGAKWDHTTDNDNSSSEIDVHVSKTRKIEKKNTRPKAEDFHDSENELLLMAANIYRVLLESWGLFPNMAMEVKLIKKAWKLTNDEKPSTYPFHYNYSEYFYC